MNAMEQTETPAAYTRGSDRTLRQQIKAKIQQLQEQRLKPFLRVADGDGSFVKALRIVDAQIAEQEAKLAKLDETVEGRETAQQSAESQSARIAFEQLVKAWEKSLLQFSRDSQNLLTAADAYAQASGERDPGRFPHRHITKAAISRRAHSVLSSSLHFDKYTPNKPIESLLTTWGIES